MRVLFADDHELLRDTLALFLHTAGIRTDTAADLDGALARIDAAGPFDLVLLDLAMPGMNGLAGLRHMLEANGGRPVALISGNVRRETVDQAKALGAAGFLEKTLSPEDFTAAIRAMASGAACPQERSEQSRSTTGERPLTRRELQVLEGFCHGQSNREIAAKLDISEPTVKLHARTLCRKLGAANRTQAAMVAREAGLF